MSDFLFEKSPIQDEDQRRKKSSKRSRQGHREQECDSDGYKRMLFSRNEEYVMRSLGCVSCDQCGAPADLEYVFEANGERMWQLRCGWWCQTTWCIKEIPGVVKEEKNEGGPCSYRLRSGRFAGKTLAEVWESDAWYVEAIASGVAKSERTRSAAEAAASFIAAKTR